ncbi:MAG: 3-phosphoshikimate 1-carboxyvinyltransferase [Pseudomonadota bacterium]
MKSIIKRQIKEQTVIVPGSKSISHRMMICASLSTGETIIDNLLLSEDILLTIDALKSMGASINQISGNQYSVKGFGGYPVKSDQRIYLGNSGTSMRLLAGIAALGSSRYTLTGNERMCERPMVELLDALSQLNIQAISENATGTPPVHIQGGNRKGGRVHIDCSKSSQYLSSLLMMGGLLENGLDIHLDTPPVSQPYIDLTMDIMKKFHVNARQMSSTQYKVDGQQFYTPGYFSVEPDLSNAGYFWAIGAVTGQMMFVDNINLNSLQGDLNQIKILEQMGCQLVVEDNRIGICGRKLTGVDVDMSDTPDAVPAIAVVASFAKGITRIRNIGHLRIKECDRIDVVASQLQKLGIQVKQGDDFLEITGGKHSGGFIETFNDHRIAMAFSIIGLLVDGIQIQNPGCVEKSFPNYWDIFDSLLGE